MIDVDIDLAQYRADAARFLSAASQGAQKATADEAEATRLRIVSGAYWTNRTGRLAQSFRVEPGVEALSATLVSGSKVARFLLNGTRPHVITPRRRDALAFVVNGARVVTRRVNHPGTQPRPFTTAEATRAEPLLAERVDAATTSAAEQTGLA